LLQVPAFSLSEDDVAEQDWSDVGIRVLALDALSAAPLSRSEAVTPQTALGDPGLPVELPPFDAPERVLWALRRGLTAAVGQDGAARVVAALPGVGDGIEISLGVVAGVGDAVGDVLREQLGLVRDGIGAVIDFYAFVYDADLWIELLKVWTAPEGTGIEGVTEYLKAEYPNLYTALRAYAPMVEKLNGLLQSLLDGSQAASLSWSVALDNIAAWMAQVPEVLGAMLRPSVEQLISDRGDPRAQGRTIGRVVGRVVIEIVLIAMDLYALIRGAAGLARDVLATTRRFLSSGELAKVVAQTEKVVPGAIAVGKDTSAATKEAVKIYGELATEISPYRKLKRKTGAFNKQVRDVTGLSLSETGYIEMRLDAQHIVEDTWYQRFAKDFEKAFGWKSSQDMDAVSLHTTWHIRKGENLATDLNLLGAEKEVSLTKALQDHLAKAQLAPDGTARPFTNLEQLFKAHADFYKTYSPRLWPRLEKWFDEAAIKLASLKTP
jgi:hypothetical protein